MPKEKKITIKPFLNQRVAPERLHVEPDGLAAEADFYPLYYQIIYDRNNTHLAAASVFGGSHSAYLFQSLEDLSREYHSQRTAKEIISRDTKLIELIIRFEVAKSSSFELRGIKESFIHYEKNLFRVVNTVCKEFLLEKLEAVYKNRWSVLFNVASENLSFYFMFTTFQKLFNVFDVYSAAEIQHIQNLRIFFDSYQQKHEAYLIPSWAHPDNVLGAMHDRNHFSLIQWLAGEMKEEFTRILSENQNDPKTIEEINSSIAWILDYAARVRNLDLSTELL